ncbi:MAG TPA: aspartate aminotransferase family protein, partial [Myxococcales bacterium]|nr:aspartate aminotransferase family protein [Myxococcales bacterium]
ADDLPQVRVRPPGPESVRWLARLKACEAPNVTTVSETFPVVWKRALGAVVQDVDDNRYIDAGSGFGVAFVGHNHPRVRAAAQQQSSLLVHAMGDVHPPMSRIELLELLAEMAPGDLGQGLLCTGGSEAVEVALKTAYLATGKSKIVAFEGGYHGLSLGALGGTWRSDFRGPFEQWVPGPTFHAPFPTQPAALQPALDSIAAVFEQGEVGVLVMEPVQGRGGSRQPAKGLLKGLRELCTRYGVMLCFDEIFTGCGRTGLMWAGDHEEVIPDLLCVGKALGGGWPMSACLGKPEVMQAWGPARGEALHTSTFLG